MFQPTTTTTSSAVASTSKEGLAASATNDGSNKKKLSRNPNMENYHGLDDFITEISESIFANMCWMFDWDHLSPCIDKRDSFAQYWRPKTREPMYSFKGSDYSRGGEFPTLLPDDGSSKSDDADDLYYMSMLALSVVESVVDMADMNGSKEGSPVPSSCLLTGFPPTPGKRKFPSGDCSSRGGKLKEKKKTHRLDECILDNDAWKTSLRIGNMWQAISGI